MSKRLLSSLLTIAAIAFLGTGCKTTDTAGTLSNPSPPKDWKPYELNLAQRAVLNVTTQFVDRPVEVVKYHTNTSIQFVTNVVEKAVPVPVYNGWLTNTIVVTNVDTKLLEEVTKTISNVTNQVAESIKVAPKAGVAAGATAVGFIPGWGQLGGAALTGMLGLFAAYTQRRLNESNNYARAKEAEADGHALTATTFAQEIEAAKALLQNLGTTPQGVNVLEKYKGWIQSHQTEAGVIGVASEIVKNEVDPQSAQFVASLLTKGELPK
jgi:hypothetical protein